MYGLMEYIWNAPKKAEITKNLNLKFIFMFENYLLILIPWERYWICFLGWIAILNNKDSQFDLYLHAVCHIVMHCDSKYLNTMEDIYSTTVLENTGMDICKDLYLYQYDFEETHEVGKL